MQAVILAAGRGRRMGNLTKIIPKPLLKIGAKNLIEYKIDALPHEVDEVIIVIGYQGHLIRECFGNTYKRRKIKYVEQVELNGTGPALIRCKDILKERFLVMMGDDIYGKKDVENILKYPWAILAKRVETEMVGAKIIVKKNNVIEDIIENSKLVPGDLNNAGLYVLGERLLTYQPVKIVGNEFGLPQMVAAASKGVDIKILEASEWTQVTTPQDLSTLRF